MASDNRLPPQRSVSVNDPDIEGENDALGRFAKEREREAEIRLQAAIQNQQRDQAQAPDTRSVAMPIASRNAAAVLAAAALSTETPEPELRRDGTAKVTEIVVAGGTMIPTSLIQKALVAAGQNIGKHGEQHNGVDNDAGKDTWAAIDNLRKMRALGNVGSRMLDDKDIALLSDHKALVEVAQEQARINTARAQATGLNADKPAATKPAAAATVKDVTHADIASFDPKFVEATFKAVVPKGAGNDTERALKYLQANGLAKEGKIGGEEVNFAMKEAIKKYDGKPGADISKSLVAKVEALTGISGLTMLAAKEAPAPAVAPAKTSETPKKSGEIEVHLAGDVRKDLSDDQWRKLAALTHAKNDGKTLEIDSDRANGMIIAARDQFTRETGRVVKNIPEMLAAYKTGTDGSVTLSSEKPVDQRTAFAMLAAATGNTDLKSGGEQGRKAMSDFQKQNGFEQTGIADAAVMKVLIAKSAEAQVASELARAQEKERSLAPKSEFADMIAPSQTPGKTRSNDTVVARK